MKRILAVMMAVLMFISLVGCGESDGGGVELFEKEGPRKDLIVGEWYYGNEESDEPDIVFNEDGSVTSPSYEEGTNIRWEFEDGYLVLTDNATEETQELAVSYVDEYEMEVACYATTTHLFKEPTDERLAQYSTKLVGTWYITESAFFSDTVSYGFKHMDFTDSASFIVFNEDGTFESMMIGAGSWVVDDDSVKLTFTDGHTDEWKHIFVTNNRICINTYYHDYTLYSKSAADRKNDYKNVPPIIFEGKYEGYNSSVEFSNIKGRKCDVTFLIENDGSTPKTISGKGEFYSIGYNEAILDFTPDGSDTIKDMGVFIKNSDIANPCFCLWIDIDENDISGYFSPMSIVVPEEIKIIVDGYFSDSQALTDITLSGGIKSIGKEAFDDCENLESITIPASVTSIGENAFSDCDNLIIHAPAGSYAEKYAKENNIPFEAE